MRRDQLEHLLRAACRIAEAPEAVVLGSQAILGSYDETELPEAAVMSIEADLAFLDDVDEVKASLVDFQIGEDSLFHGTFGYYAQGVHVEVAILPRGWRDRLVVFETEGTDPGRGLCLEPHDLVVAKLLAHREKDLAFARALLDADLVDRHHVLSRLDVTDTSPIRLSRARGWLAR